MAWLAQRVCDSLFFFSELFFHVRLTVACPVTGLGGQIYRGYSTAGRNLHVCELFFDYSINRRTRVDEGYDILLRVS